MRSLTFPEIPVSALEATRRLAAHPFRYLALTLAFLLVAEATGTIPVAGFVLKTIIAGLLSAQTFRIFADADRGSPPKLAKLWHVFALPASSLLVLAVSALLPFTTGVLYLVLVESDLAGARFFFSNIFQATPPAPEVFFRFKLVMFATALPLTFIAAEIVLMKTPAGSAIRRGIHASLRNMHVLVLIVGLSVVLELIVRHLSFLPGPMRAVLVPMLLLVFVAWIWAFRYSIATRVYDYSTTRASQTSSASHTATQQT